MTPTNRENWAKSVALIVLCIGLTGCLNHGEPPLTHYGNGYNTQPNVAGGPQSPNDGNPTAPGSEIQSTAYQPSQVQLGGGAQPAPGKPKEVSVGQAGFGTPLGTGETPPGIGTAQGVDGLPMMMPPGFSLPSPRELQMTAHAPHRVAAPDILFIEALRLVPKGPYRLDAMEVLQIEVSDTLPRQDIKGLFMISPDGALNLGFNYGSVRVGELTVDQAQAAIRTHLGRILKNPTVNVVLVQMRGMQNIKGEHLVRPDGTVSLGLYGSVYVAGMTLGQVKTIIENHLGAYLVNPQVAVDVFAYNSRKIYVVADGAGYGQQVIALPVTGNETVLDVVSRVQGLPPVASLRRIWVSRPSPAGNPTSQILPVDWKAITMAGRTETNHQLLAGDRLYISADPWITAYNLIRQRYLISILVYNKGVRQG
ncbi:MAG: hypothetical protein EXS16_21195 [Gemmataceae bacterium]|nr:hypothetical protein [Gemmataceae bacterium]